MSFLCYWDWLCYPGLLPVLVSITFSPFAFHISVFSHSLFLTCHWISFIFLLYDRRVCTHSVKTYTYFSSKFSSFGQANVMVPESEQGVCIEQKSQSKFLPGPGLNLGIL